jgi:hypothetical protein
MTAPRPPRSTADKLAAAATTPATTPATAVRHAVPTAPRNGDGTIKFTVHLDPDRHRALKLLALDASVPASTIIRALIDLTVDSPEIRAQVHINASADR